MASKKGHLGFQGFPISQPPRRGWESWETWETPFLCPFFPDLGKLGNLGKWRTSKKVVYRRLGSCCCAADSLRVFTACKGLAVWDCAHSSVECRARPAAFLDFAGDFLFGFGHGFAVGIPEAPGEFIDAVLADDLIEFAGVGHGHCENGFVNGLLGFAAFLKELD